MKKVLVLLSMIFAVNSWAAKEVERFALVVGKNSGGDGRKILKFANRDAENYRNVLIELGGLRPDHTITLENPQKDQIFNALKEMKTRIQSQKKDTRKEFFFYYSGHSDERGLLIDADHLSYLDLKNQIDSIKSEVSIVVLDSCSSGNFTALKSGRKIPSFINSSMSSLKGKVFLASSSSNEFAQESDQLKGSFFTHNLVNAMRGAADLHPDGRITLNEAYQYAYNETLAQTESSLGGVQHPSYSIQLVGNGELVMTDLSEASGQLIFDQNLDGLIFVRGSDDVLVAEVRKFPGKNLAIAVSPGSYKVGLGSREQYRMASADVGEKGKTFLQASHFTEQRSGKYLTKGSDEPIDVVNAEFSIIPDLSTYPYEEERRTLHHFSLSLIYSRYEILEGAAISVGGNIVDEEMKGAQFSVVGNMSKGNMVGAQFAHGLNYVKEEAKGAQFAAVANYAGTSNHLYQFSGIANHLKDGGKGAQISAISNTSFADYTGAQITAVSNVTRGDIKGAQIAAIFNKAEKVTGTQIGLVNMADEVDGASVGVVNLIKKNGEMALGYRYDDLGFHSIYFRSGTKNFYTLFQAAHDSDYDDFAGGIGGKASWKKLEFGLEYMGHSLKPNYFHGTDALTMSRLTFFVNPYQTKYINLIFGLNYNHLTSTDAEALERFNRFRGSSDNAWFGYQAGIEIRF